MIVSVSMTEAEAAAFKVLGGSKWLHGAISRAVAVQVRRDADEAVCEYLERFADEEIRNAVAGVDQAVPFESFGKQYMADFYLSTEALAGLEGEALSRAIDRVIRDMAVEIREA